MKKIKSKILVILGPTASGKSDLAVQLAKKFKGEVISADSRQVYKDMDLGSGKITPKEMSGISHHLLDVISPKQIYSVANYQKEAQQKITEILSRNKLPIIAGGTGFYIQSIVDNLSLPEVPPNTKLRTELAKKTNEELFTILKNLDLKRSKRIDPQNPHRLIRAIEIVNYLGKVPALKKEQKYDTLQIGLQTGPAHLEKKIISRLKKRLKQGMIAEVKKLHTSGITWKRLESFGLEYTFIAQFLQHKISQQEMEEKIIKDSLKYAKRQMTWFRKDKRIIWISNPKEASKLVRAFLN